MNPLAFTVAAALAVSATAFSASANERTYDVTIQNLTTGQPLSPGVAVTHASNIYLFRPGQRTNPGIATLAKSGMPGDAIAALNRFRGRGVTDVVMADKPIMVRGSGKSTSESFTIRAKDGDVLSWARMLICTNDGIVGTDSIPLNGQPVTVRAFSYDAGAEINDERSSSIVDACGKLGPVALAEDGDNDTLPTDGNITRRHPNIRGGGALGREHAWNGPTALVTITPRGGGGGQYTYSRLQK